jgi:hypothetical protein
VTHTSKCGWAISYRWIGWVWEITGWSSRLQENYISPINDPDCFSENALTGVSMSKAIMMHSYSCPIFEVIALQYYRCKHCESWLVSLGADFLLNCTCHTAMQRWKVLSLMQLLFISGHVLEEVELRAQNVLTILAINIILWVWEPIWLFNERENLCSLW